VRGWNLDLWGKERFQLRTTSADVGTHESIQVVDSQPGDFVDGPDPYRLHHLDGAAFVDRRGNIAEENGKKLNSIEEKGLCRTHAFSML
jgi:hypothetical protein